jgi:hypothetical protein
MHSQTERWLASVFLSSIELDSIATVAINRPKVMNALAADTVRALRRAIEAVGQSADVLALLLTGCGRAFCTGADLTDPEISLDGLLEDRARKLANLIMPAFQINSPPRNTLSVYSCLPPMLKKQYWLSAKSACHDLPATDASPNMVSVRRVAKDCSLRCSSVGRWPFW